MSFGRITGSIGKAVPRDEEPEFFPQGIAYPTEVSAGLVQDLIGTYGSRTPSDPQYKRTTYISGGAAHEVSGEGAEYIQTATRIVSGIEGMNFASDVLSRYPGQKAGLIAEIADVFYQYMTGNSTSGEARLGQIQAGFQEAVDLVTKQKQADMQNQIDYLMYISNKMAKELPYGEAWFLETAEANIRATNDPSSMKKWRWDELISAEAQRLRWVAAETERQMDAYEKQAAELRGYASAIGPALSEMVTKLFGDVAAEIQGLSAESAKRLAAEQAEAIRKYCSEQQAALDNYLRLTKEFNAVIEEAVTNFTVTNTEFWSKVGV